MPRTSRIIGAVIFVVIVCVKRVMARVSWCLKSMPGSKCKSSPQGVAPAKRATRNLCIRAADGCQADTAIILAAPCPPGHATSTHYAAGVLAIPAARGPAPAPRARPRVACRVVAPPGDRPPPRPRAALSPIGPRELPGDRATMRRSSSRDPPRRLRPRRPRRAAPRAPVVESARHDRRAHQHHHRRAAGARVGRTHRLRRLPAVEPGDLEGPRRAPRGRHHPLSHQARGHPHAPLRRPPRPLPARPRAGAAPPRDRRRPTARAL